MTFLTDLATNATNKGVDIVIYSGNDDSLVSRFSSEVVIQVRLLLSSNYSLPSPFYRIRHSEEYKASVGDPLRPGSMTSSSSLVSSTKSATGLSSSSQAQDTWCHSSNLVGYAPLYLIVSVNLLTKTCRPSSSSANSFSALTLLDSSRILRQASASRVAR